MKITYYVLSLLLLAKISFAVDEYKKNTNQNPEEMQQKADDDSRKRLAVAEKECAKTLKSIVDENNKCNNTKTHINHSANDQLVLKQMLLTIEMTATESHLTRALLEQLSNHKNHYYFLTPQEKRIFKEIEKFKKHLKAAL